MAARDIEPKVSPLIERFSRQLLVTNKAVALYPSSSTIPRDTAEDTANVLREALREQSEVRLSVTKQGLHHHGVMIFPGQSAFASFARELYNRRLAEVRFHAGIEAAHIIAFLEVAKSPVEEIAASGGFGARMWERNVDTITVTEVQVTLLDVDGDSDTNPDEFPVPDRAELDHLLAATMSGSPRDHRTLVRAINQPSVIRNYLHEVYAEPDEPSNLSAVGARFSELAQAAFELSPENQDELMRSLGQALWELEPSLRRDMLVETVLPEARTSEPLSAVVRQMNVDDICRVLVEGLGTGDISNEGLVRAIRNLATISLTDREEVIHATGAAMLGAGIGESVVSDVLGRVAPARLTVRERAGAQGSTDSPADAILRLVDLAPRPAAVDGDDAELAALRDEARRGITDGDVISAYVSLVGMDTREAQFASTMSMLEDSLDLIIARGELRVAADAAASMTDAAENPDLTEQQRTRIQEAVRRFARPCDVREIAKALRLYKEDTVEHAAAQRLLDTLGPLAIPPLLEQLADEPDMAARKAMVDLLSRLASNYIQELGSHVGDARWYFVRNVVGILGSTRSSAALMYLERTLRHADARVRRETIRGLSAINDRIATEMLIASLDDEDAQNVQLAARYLGSGEVRGAVSALEQVANGEGRGNRENGPRVEAIEALGRLVATESLPVLESLAGKRKLIGAAKARELRAAAESAITRIRTGGGAS